MHKIVVTYLFFAVLTLLMVFALDAKGMVSIRFLSFQCQMPLYLLLSILLTFVFIVTFGGFFCVDFWCKKLRENIHSFQKLPKNTDIDGALFDVVKTMTSTTEGDMKSARKYLKDLQEKIGHHLIIDILDLKILKGEKNFDALQKLSEKLLKNKDAELVGLKALVETGKTRGEALKALESANKAFGIRQDLYWVLENTFYLRAKSGDWQGALEVLEAGHTKRLITRERYKTLKAVALYAFGLNGKENTLLCLKHIMLSHELDPYFVPSALELAKLYMKDNQARKAEKILKDIWRKNPTIDIAKAYLNLYPNDTALDRVKRMESFALLNASKPSLNNYILADLDMKAKLFDKARAEFELFLVNNPATKSIAKLIAKYEKTVRHNESSAKKWEKRAQNADAECVYVCSKCGKISPKWLPFCPDCGDFNPFEWSLCLNKRKK